MKIIKNEMGMTLIEIMAAAGLMGGLAVGGMTMFKTQTTSQKTVEQNYETISTLGSIRGILTDVNNCKNTFNGRLPNDASPPVNHIVKLVAGVDQNIYPINSALPGTSLKILSYGLSNTYPGLASDETMLVVTFSRGKNTHNDTIAKTIKLNYSVSSGTISSCYAVSSGGSDSLWQISATNMDDIFFNSGNVGIGNSDPDHKLHVTGNSKITGHMAVGNNAEINTYNTSGPGPMQSVLNVEENVPATPYFTGVNTTLNLTGPTTGWVQSMNNWMVNTSSHNIHAMGGVFNSIQHKGSGNVRFMQAQTNSTWVQSGGTVEKAQGSVTTVDHNGPGTVNEAMGTYVRVLQRSTGPITNSYGHFISTIGGTNRRSIYSEDALAPSYFAGNIGVGITTPRAKLHIKNGPSGVADINMGGNNSVLGVLEGNGVSNFLQFALPTNNIAGLLFSTPTHTSHGVYFFRAQDSTHIWTGRTANGAGAGMSLNEHGYSISRSGNIYASPSELMLVNGTLKAVSYVYSSDKRLKKDVTAIENPLDKISRLKGVNFTWKKTGDKDVGFIAQDVEKVEPRLVVTSQDKLKTKSVKYGNIVAIAVEAIKELMTGQQELESEMAQLRMQNELLKKRLDEQEARLRKQEELSRLSIKTNP